MEEKERKGYKWVECSTGGGYWSKVTGTSHKHKLSFFCPHCQRPTGTVDDQYLQEYGICYLCFTMHIDQRQVPTIDLSKYKKA